MNMDLSNYCDKWREIYFQALAKKGYEVDDAQLDLVDEFARLDRDLATTDKTSTEEGGFFSRLFGQESQSQTSDTMQGIYCYGTVGRGKTFLMDLFCKHIEAKVTRLHYHHFMQDIHTRLSRLSDLERPLDRIAADYAKEIKLLCLDEFFVNDITNAMILYGLLRALIENRVVIVTTSNVKPDNLYQGGLQRAQFLPAIKLINQKFNVVHIADGEDHRRATLATQPHFLHPLNNQTKQQLNEIVEKLTKGQHVESNGSIEINQRDIDYKKRTNSLIWFDFSEICQTARSQIDYIELAKIFQYFVISNIPELDIYEEDSARRLLMLVDELYDRRKDLLITSEKPMEAIYSGEKMRFEFTRLQSRLHEMQSSDYGK